MITIGLVTWAEHASLVPGKEKITLSEYAQFFPVVEIDSLYYGIRGPKMIEKWQGEVPASFQFILKGNKAMTKQGDLHDYYENETELFTAYKNAIAPLVKSHQLKAILLQFPPFFHLNEPNIQYLRRIRAYLEDLPVAIEMRSSTWYDPVYRESFFNFMKKMKFIHVIPDEPQTPSNSVPAVFQATNPDLTIFRLHGRNTAGWMNANGQSWRKTRTLYRYSDIELESIASHAKQMTKESKEVCVIFNNNSGGDAAGNALELQKILGINFDGLAPQQTELF